MQPPEQIPSRSGAIALIVVGLVILIPSGLCTGVVALGPLVYSIISSRNSVGAMGAMPVALAFGGPFIVGGAALVRSGMRRMRKRRERGADPEKSASYF